MTKTALKIRSRKGKLLHTYPGQLQPQGRYIEVSKDGLLYIDWNAEIGNAVPASVWHGREKRIHGSWNTKNEVVGFIRANRELFERLVAGMDEDWDGNNNVGTLTDDAAEALESLEYNAYNEAY